MMGITNEQCNWLGCVGQSDNEIITVYETHLEENNKNPVVKMKWKEIICPCGPDDT